MGEKKTVAVPEAFRRQWDEVRVCATLLREGQARIAVAERKDGTKCRYTKIR